MIATDVGIAVVPGAFLGQAIRLADRRVEIDREWRCAGAGAGGPGPREELTADPVELADVAPAEAAQERAQGRRGLHPEAQDPLGPARPQGVGVVDAIATGEG